VLFTVVASDVMTHVVAATHFCFRVYATAVYAIIRYTTPYIVAISRVVVGVCGNTY